MKHLIDKDTLVAEIERLKTIYNDEENIHHIAKYNILIDILSFINTLEVKEVDLDFQMFAKEMDAIFALPSSKTKNTEKDPLNWEYAIAKHFFELGLKAQKVNKEENK